MAKKINEAYLNMTSVPTQVITSNDEPNPWHICDMECDDFNVGIDTNVAPMVGAQGGQSLATMGRDCCDINTTAGIDDLDYYNNMAGIAGTETVDPLPTPVVNPVAQPEVQEFGMNDVEIPDDVYGNGDYGMTMDDYNDILINSRFDNEEMPELMVQEPVEEEVSVPSEIYTDPYDGLIDDETMDINTTAEPEIVTPDVETPVAEPVEEIPVEEAEVENFVTEGNSTEGESFRQQIVDYLVHNKEVIYGPNSAKVNSYKKELEAKSDEELKDEAKTVSPNWEKYISKYEVSEPIETEGTEEEPLNESKKDCCKECKCGKECTCGKDCKCEEKADMSEDCASKYQSQVEEIAQNYEPEVVEVKKDETGYSVLLKDKNSDFQAWMDVYLQGGEWVADWNQYIFNLTFGSDCFQKACQENDTIAMLSFEAAEGAVMNDIMPEDRMNQLAGVPSETTEVVNDELEEEIPEGEELLTEEGEEVTEEDMTEIGDMELEESAQDGVYTFNFKKINEGIAPYYVVYARNPDGSFYGYLAKHPDNENMSYYVNEIEDAIHFTDPQEAEAKAERFENGGEVELEVKEYFPEQINESEEVVNVDVEPKEYTAPKKEDLNHKIPENPMIKDNIDTGKEVEYSIELEGGEVKTFGSKSDIEVKTYITENAKSIKSIVII